jgi:SepF-like predicted cell division protein (DUF552 family)
LYAKAEAEEAAASKAAYAEKMKEHEALETLKKEQATEEAKVRYRQLAAERAEVEKQGEAEEKRKVVAAAAVQAAEAAEAAARQVKADEKVDAEIAEAKAKHARLAQDEKHKGEVALLLKADTSSRANPRIL